MLSKERINIIGSPDNAMAVSGRLPLEFGASYVSIQPIGGDFSHPNKVCIKIRVEENASGCPGYVLSAGVGYIVSVIDNTSGTVQLGPFPMVIKEISPDSISLQGGKCIKESLFGNLEADNSQIGLTLFFKDRIVNKCVVTRIDTGRNYMYFNLEGGSETSSSIGIEAIELAIDNCRRNFDAEHEDLKNDIERLNSMLKEYGAFKAVQEIADKSTIAECFLLSILLDVNTIDKTNAAELALYALNDCLLDEEHKLRDDIASAYLNLFNLVYHGHDLLTPLVQRVVHKGDTDDEAIEPGEGDSISNTVLDQIAYQCIRIIRPYVYNDRFAVLEPEEQMFYNRLFLRGGNLRWFDLSNLKSLLILLSEEVERKNTL